MTRLAHTLALLFCLVSVVGCDHSAPPPRSSPLLTPIEATADATITDRMRPDLVWYDAGLDRVVRLDDGVVVSVQERHVRRELGAPPTQMRVFDDGSIVVVANGLFALPADGSPAIAISVPVSEAIDGASADDFWVGGWALSTGTLPGASTDYGACHVVAHAIARCVDFPNVGGYDAPMAVASDGSVYMTDRDLALYRFDGSRVLEVARFETEITGFRCSGASVIAITYSSGAFRVDGDHASAITYDGAYFGDLAGSADDFYFSLYDAAYENVDPSCHSGFFTSCTQQIVWSQTTIYHSVDGHTSEVGHERCTAAMEEACSFETVALGVDGDHAVVLGPRIRRTN